MKIVYEILLYTYVYVTVFTVVLYFAVRGWHRILCRSKSKKKKSKGKKIGR